MTFNLLQKRARSGQRGLTLLELLVVLSILAVLSTVALTSSSGIADQARYEATQRTLENIREAIIGLSNMMDTDGTPLRSGFVADMGRLPRAVVSKTVSGADIFTLGELLQNTFTTPMRTYATLPATELNIGVPTGFVRADEADPEVVLGTGWRGPYLRLAPGNLIVRDGWGVEFATPSIPVPAYPYPHLYTLAGTAVSTNEEIARVVALGQDDLPGGMVDSYDADVVEAIQETDYQSNIKVTVTVHMATGVFANGAAVNVAVRYFAPNADDGGLFVATDTSPVTGTGTSTVTFTATFGVIPPATTSVPIGAPAPTVGPRALRAYYHDTLPATHANTTGAPSATKGQSAVAYLTIRPGANVRSLFINLP